VKGQKKPKGGSPGRRDHPGKGKGSVMYITKPVTDSKKIVLVAAGRGKRRGYSQGQKGSGVLKAHSEKKMNL